MMQPVHTYSPSSHSAVITMAGSANHGMLSHLTEEFSQDNELAEYNEIDSLVATAHQAIHDAKRALEEAASHGSGEHVSQCQQLLLEARGCLSEALEARQGKPVGDIARRISGIIVAVRIEATAIEAEHHEKVAEPAKKITPPPPPKPKPIAPKPILVLRSSANTAPSALPSITAQLMNISLHPIDLHAMLTPIDLPEEHKEVSVTPTPVMTVHLHPSPNETFIEMPLPPLPPLPTANPIEPTKETPQPLAATVMSVANDAIDAMHHEAALIYDKAQAAKREAVALADQLWNLGVSGLTHIGEGYKLSSSIVAGFVSTIAPTIPR